MKNNTSKLYRRIAGQLFRESNTSRHITVDTNVRNYWLAYFTRYNEFFNQPWTHIKSNVACHLIEIQNIRIDYVKNADTELHRYLIQSLSVHHILSVLTFYASSSKGLLSKDEGVVRGEKFFRFV